MMQTLEKNVFLSDASDAKMQLAEIHKVNSPCICLFAVLSDAEVTQK